MLIQRCANGRRYALSTSGGDDSVLAKKDGDADGTKGKAKRVEAITQNSARREGYCGTGTGVVRSEDEAELEMEMAGAPRLNVWPSLPVRGRRQATLVRHRYKER
jgi:hypothetical protein